jgi:Mg2+ and Co2+ transporter CorA
LLLGTHDLVMTRVAQRTNDTVKVLTIISAVLLPASLLSSILGMNFTLPFFDDAGNFWLAVAGMLALMGATLAAALARDRA